MCGTSLEHPLDNKLVVLDLDSPCGARILLKKRAEVSIECVASKYEFLCCAVDDAARLSGCAQGRLAAHVENRARGVAGFVISGGV